MNTNPSTGESGAKTDWASLIEGVNDLCTETLHCNDGDCEYAAEIAIAQERHAQLERERDDAEARARHSQEKRVEAEAEYRDGMGRMGKSLRVVCDERDAAVEAVMGLPCYSPQGGEGRRQCGFYNYVCDVCALKATLLTEPKGASD